MTKSKVLVFPCGSEIGLEIYDSLCFSTYLTLYGASSTSDHGEFTYENYIKELLPFVDDENFINKINELVRKYKIEYIFPAHDSVVLELAEARERGELECAVITSDLRTCRVARSKKLTYETLSEIVTTPKIYERQYIKDSSFPLFIKPDVGQGSKGAQLVNNFKDLEYCFDNDSSLIVMENLPGKEYTVDCFTDLKGNLLFCDGRVRSRVSNGISVRSSPETGVNFREMAEKISSKLSFRGAWFFQVKKSKHEELVLLEIAPRIAGTMGLTRCRGVNLPLLSLFDAMGVETKIAKNGYNIMIDRALGNNYRHTINYDKVYIDLDDVLIVNDKVNVIAITLIFQCINKGIKVVLITRHKSILDQTLSVRRISGLFDEVIWVKEGAEKLDYINPKNAIFIDDSFKEREKVFSKFGIPVFDSHMVEALIEKTF